MHKIFISALLYLLFTKSFAQQIFYKTQFFNTGKAVVTNLSAIREDWMPYLQNIEKPAPGSNRAMLLSLKEEMRKKYPLKENRNYYKDNNSNSVYTAQAPSPLIKKNFEANTQDSGWPLDNDMAISNDGKLISVTNSVIYIYDIKKDTLLLTKSLDAFASSLKPLNRNKFDPKVIYDPIEDRFIITFLCGSTYQISNSVIAFSQTNDPTANWNLYKLPGNPLNNNLWSDYPMIAITEKDFFLTLNLLKNNMPWQTGFSETIIWQIQKAEAYRGDSLVNILHSGITYNGEKIRNLCPVKGGSEISGPNMYFLSNRNLAVSNDSLFLVEVTNSVSSGNVSLKTKLAIAPFEYFMPPNAHQANNVFLQTNDSRILGGFLHNNQIQFVQNTLDTSTGLAAIYHGTMKNLSAGSPQVTAHIIGDPELDFGYPNISYCGSSIKYSGINPGENEALITFSHTSPSSFAGTSAVYCSNKGEYSPVISIKNGDNYIDQSPGSNYERWGDYSGSQRKYNDPGKVWMASTFGKADKTYGTWIAELGSLDSVKLQQPASDKFIIFPNPVKDIVSVNFNLDSEKMLTFSVYDLQGRLIKRLMEDFTKPGQNLFSFSIQPLSSGLYFLRIESEDQVILNQKIIKD